MITDGKSKDDIKTPGRALKKIAHVMAIGVGVKVRAKDLFELATSDEYVYTPESQGTQDSVSLKGITVVTTKLHHPQLRRHHQGASFFSSYRDAVWR